MKTILLIIALTGLTAAGSYAQDKNCCCKKTAVHHKTVQRRVAAKAVSKKQLPDNDACYTYRQHNIVVTECPGTSYSNDDNYGYIGYVKESDYLGYFPVANSVNTTESAAPRSDLLLVSSTAFTDNGVIPSKYTCEGEHASPPLNVANIPAGTRSLAVVMYDPNANANGSMTYWLVWNIDTSGVIPENFISDNQSINAAKEWGYQAVCPVSGTHYYHFMVYALDTKLLAGRQTTKASLERTMSGHILAKGEITGVYNKHLDK